MRERIAVALYAATEGKHWDRTSRYEAKVLDAVLDALSGLTPGIR